MKKNIMRKIAIVCLLSVIISMTVFGNNSVSMGKTSSTKKTVIVTISCAGDCTIGSDPNFNPYTNFHSVVKRVRDKAYFFKNVRRYFAKDDMTLVNFEGTLTPRKTRAPKKFTFRGPYSYVNILKKGDIEAVAFANNHCRDFGQGSYYDTIRTFKKAGIKYSSYSRVCSYTVKKNDTKIRIGMVSVNGLEGIYSSRRLIKSGIRKLKKKKCALIIMSMHAGTERVYTPTSTQKNLARYAIDQGANLVLGHHPHVLHGVSRYKGAYIVYSLGNFCFGGNSNPSDKDTMIARPSFTFKNGKLKKKETVMKLIPCCLSSTKAYNNYQPTPQKGSERKRNLRKINRMCEALGTTLHGKNGKLTTILSVHK